MNDEKAVPWISRITWFWAVILTVATSGIFALVLAIYLAWWFHQRRTRSLALYGYALVALLWVPEALFWRHFTSGDLGGILFTVGAILWFPLAFQLRREIRNYYDEVYNVCIPINGIMTLLLSVYYLNYCLWENRDLNLRSSIVRS
jgi:hypothetical protein